MTDQTLKDIDRAFKALAERDDVLDKIRAEIEERAKINQNLNTVRARALCWCLDVIDKYRAESEDEEYIKCQDYAERGTDEITEHYKKLGEYYNGKDV